jgi:hypothetical protein
MPMPTQPTKYAPGSDGKIAELERRCALHQDLWHPEDVTYADIELRANGEGYMKIMSVREPRRGRAPSGRDWSR